VREGPAKLVCTVGGDERARCRRRVGLAASVVNSVAYLVLGRHLWSRVDFVRRTEAEMGEIVMQGIVPILSRTPGRLTDWSRRPGSDNDVVLSGLLGDTRQQIREISASDP